VGGELTSFQESALSSVAGRNRAELERRLGPANERCV
jgi:hypothetical protein